MTQGDALVRHEHHHHHHHAETASGMGAVFAVGVALNLGFVLVEAAFGIVGHSVALLADAGHNLGDVLGLAIAWGAAALARRRPTRRYTYGLRSSSILAALFNAIVLLIAVGAIAVEAINRFAAPQPVATGTVMVVAAIGIVVNGATALLLRRGHHHHRDAKVRAAALVSATGWLWLDPAASLVVALIIVASTWRLLRDAVNMALDAVPAGIDPAQVRAHLGAVAGVCAVHDLHIWPMSTTETALTCHLVMPAGHPGDHALAMLAADLHDRFGIEHSTIQVETGDPEHPCRLDADHVV